MSNEEIILRHDETLRSIERTVNNGVRVILGVVIAGAIGAGGMIYNDHESLREVTEWKYEAKPKVEQLWDARDRNLIKGRASLLQDDPLTMPVGHTYTQQQQQKY